MIVKIRQSSEKLKMKKIINKYLINVTKIVITKALNNNDSEYKKFLKGDYDNTLISYFSIYINELQPYKYDSLLTEFFNYVINDSNNENNILFLVIKLYLNDKTNNVVKINSQILVFGMFLYFHEFKKDPNQFFQKDSKLLNIYIDFLKKEKDPNFLLYTKLILLYYDKLSSGLYLSSDLDFAEKLTIINEDIYNLYEKSDIIKNHERDLFQRNINIEIEKKEIVEKQPNNISLSLKFNI
jgi:hypothetical protein